MKDIIGTIVIVGILLFLPIGFLSFLYREMTAENAQKQQKYEMSISDAYDRGFFAGSVTAINHIQMNTNTGRWTLELTNVFNDLNMKRKESAVK